VLLRRDLRGREVRTRRVAANWDWRKAEAWRSPRCAGSRARALECGPGDFVCDSGGFRLPGPFGKREKREIGGDGVSMERRAWRRWSSSDSPGTGDDVGADGALGSFSWKSSTRRLSFRHCTTVLAARDAVGGLQWAMKVLGDASVPAKISRRSFA